MFRLIFSPLWARIACLLAFFLPLSPSLAIACCTLPADENAAEVRHHRHTGPATLLLASTGGALLLGAEDRFGRKFRRDPEKVLPEEEAAPLPQAPSIRLGALQIADGGNRSPNGRPSNTAELVTPFILSYKDQHPAVWLLATLPAYEMAKQLNSGARQQKDVLAGAALGGMKGYYEHDDGGKLVVRLRPRGVFIGYRKLLK